MIKKTKRAYLLKSVGSFCLVKKQPHRLFINFKMPYTEGSYPEDKNPIE